MGTRINIYQQQTVDGSVREVAIYKTYISADSVHEEEMGMSNLIRLSFDGEDNVILPAGSYIKVDGVKYRLLESYAPKAEGSRRYKYAPEFQHPVMLLSRTPYFHLDGNTSGEDFGQIWSNATKETEWSFYGYAETLVEDAVSYIKNYLQFQDSALAAEIGASSWECVVDDFGKKVVEISVGAENIMSVISQAADQCGCEFHFDFRQKILYFGDVANLLTSEPFVLKSGFNVTHANVTSNSEQYYNRYIVRGGTTNLSQPSYMGGNTRVTKRLTLEGMYYPDTTIEMFPDSILDLRGNANVPSDIRSDANEPALTGQITMDDVYPHLKVYIYNPRERRCYKLDENGNELTDQIYSKWYIRLAYKTTEAEYDENENPLFIAQETVGETTYYWYPYVITDEMRIHDTDLQVSFLPNYDTETYSSPLVGRTFVIVPFYEDTQENEHNVGHIPFNVFAGEYRIDFEEDDGLVIPTGTDQGLYPQGAATPSHENNIVSVIGVVVTDELKTEARSELLAEAIAYIQYQRKNRKTYTFDTYVRHFNHYRKNPNFRLYVGQKVIYDDGGDLIGGTSMRLETKIRKLVTHLTDPNNIRIDVGNERIVGRRESYEKKVETLITYVGSGGGGTISDATFLKLLTTYGRRLFLSKTEDDTAVGGITFMKESLHKLGASFGPLSEIWGYVKSVGGVGRAWFRNLFSLNFETQIARITEYITGSGGLKIRDDVTISKGENGTEDATLDVANIESDNIDNSDTIKTHNLVVTGLAHFFELVIDKIRAAGGAMILTPAEGFVVAAIDKDVVSYPQDPNNYYHASLNVTLLYYKAKDKNGKSITQSWKVGDQALCRNFHSVEEMKVGQVTQNVNNKYYWSLVLAVSENTVNLTIDGELVACHWIMIYSGVMGSIPDGIDANNHGVPLWNDKPLWDGDPSVAAVGDEIVMLGYRGSESDATERKSAVYMSAYSALDTDLHAPFLAFYQGIDDFDISTHRKTYMDANGSKFFGEFYALSATGNGDDLTQKVNNMMSSDILTPTEKRQLRERWDEMVARHTMLIGLANDLGLSNNYDEYRDGCTYEDAMNNEQNVFYFLYIFLSGDFRDRGINAKVVPSWIADGNIDTNTDLSSADLITSWNTYVNSPHTEDINLPIATTTLLTVHNKFWADLYANIEELSRAIDIFQMSTIENIGSDDLLSAKEKAMLRQTFANEISEYFQLKSELAAFGTTIYKEVEDPNDPSSTITVEVSTMYVEAAIDALGTYLNGGDNWKVEQQAKPDAQTTYWPTYPLWISESSTTSSTAITASEFSAKWADVFEAMETLSADIANASQEKIDHITASVEVPNKYVTEIDPLQNPSISANVKEGDFWYQPVTLNDPIHGGTLSGDYYNEYLCQGSGNGKHWVLLNAAQAALLNVARDICLAVFDTNNSSSIVQRISSIVQSVSGMKIGGRNLILNSDFSERNGSVPRRFELFGTSVYLALDSTDAPTLFTDSLLVTANAAGGGLCLPLGKTGQPNLRLESDSGYVLSFYIKLTQHTGTAPIIEVKRGIPTNAVVIPNGSVQIDETWQRLSFFIDGDGNNVPIYITKQTSGAFRIAGLQLEKGNVLSDWRRAEEDWQGQIELTKTLINLRVTSDGLAQAGLQINGEDESVTIIGKKTKIEGDLDIQGLTTENVTVVNWNTQRPIVVNMGLFQDDTDEDNVTVKSVQVKARNVALTESNVGIPPLVALPFYDSAIEGNKTNNWRVNGNTYISFEQTAIGEDTSYTFNLFEDASVPDSMKRVMAYKRNGTRLTIINEADPFTANWQTLATYPSNDSSLKNNVKMLMGNAVVVCADARIISSENIEAEGGERNQLTPNNTEEAWIWNAGLFSCGGYQARFIAVLPGQSLQLRSQIMTIDKDNNTQEVLVWVVENSSEFVPLKTPLSCDGIMLYQGYQPTFAPTQSHRGVEDCWMGHPVLNLANDIYNPITLDLALVRYGVEGD